MRVFLRYSPVLLFVCLSVSPGQSEAGDVVYRIDPAQSVVGFELQATGHRIHGQTHAVRGMFRLPGKVDRDTLQLAAKIEITAGKLETGNGRRDRRMRKETLDVQRYPLIRFDLERIVGKLDQLRAGRPFTGRLEGRLSIRDVTKDVSIVSRVQLSGETLAVNGRFALRFTDYHVPDPSILFLRVQKDMVATFSVVCTSSY